MTEPGNTQVRSAETSRRGFLRDVLICSLGAYGGPETHIGIPPGPTSTQTIVSIGYKVDGRLLALLTLLVWAMVVGFILYAAIRIGRKVVVDKTTAALFFCSAVATFFSRQPLVFPIVLLLGGAGQVVVPVMQSELVDLRRYMTNQEFLAGYGQVQGLPGPMFSFAAYAGGIATRDMGVLSQILGAAP